MYKPSPESASDAREPFDDLLGYHLRRSSVVVMADLTATLAPLQLKPAGASILFMIEANPGITQSDVGKALGILRANMAPLVAALHKQGRIEREPVDGRSQALRLSAEGLAACRLARKATKAHEQRLFGALSTAARARLIGQLRVLWRSAQTVEVTP